MATHRRASRSRGFLPPYLLTAKATIVLAALAAGTVLAATIALVAVGEHSFGYYRNDPAQTLEAFPLIGLMSQAGVLLIWAAAAICGFAGVFVARSLGWRPAAPLLAFGASSDISPSTTCSCCTRTSFPAGSASGRSSRRPGTRSPV